MKRAFVGAAALISAWAVEARATDMKSSVNFYADLFAVAALCPSMKIDDSALATGAMPAGASRESWSLIVEEGRRTSPDKIREMVAFPQTAICDYGRKAYGPANGGYLVDR